MDADWLPSNLSGDRNRVHLYCLPHAGGGAAVFHRIGRNLSGWIEIAPLKLAGRESRLHEPVADNLTQLAAEVAAVIARRKAEHFALLGYSLGGLISFEVTRELIGEYGIAPQQLIVASCRAPHLLADEGLHRLADEQFVEKISTRYGGIAPEATSDPRLMEIMLPTLRADIKMIETYEYVDRTPLDVPILALRGTEDRQVSVAHTTAWQQHTSRELVQRSFPGGHFFLSEGNSAAIQWIARRLPLPGTSDDD